VPACGYTQTFTSTATSSKITSTALDPSISYSVQSNDLLDAGDHTVTVLSTLNNSPSTIDQKTFKVTMVDPCLSTSLSSNPQAVENLVSFAGYTTKSQFRYSFNDSVSLSNTLKPDFCGEKLLDVKLNGTTTTYLKASSSDYIYFSPPAETTNFGIG